MSGLCGWFGRSSNLDSIETLERMARALPSYGQIESHASSGAGFGLALRAHPAAGAFMAGGGFTAAIEGYPEWADDTSREVARTKGHAEALVSAYRRKGPAFFDILRGAFSFALFDHASEKVVIAIDRFGIQTLCYAQSGHELLVFGSTTDAVRAHPDIKTTIRIQSIHDYLYFIDRIVAPTTIYHQQKKLVPGEYIMAERQRTQLVSYWRMPYRATTHVDKAAAAQELRSKLQGAVKASLVGENTGRVGAFLSGGLDSSSVVGVASGLISHPLQTFTIGFPVEGFDEAEYADIAAKRFKTKHEIYYLQPQDVVDILLKSVQIYDEPFANSSLVPAYHCARLAKAAGVEMMLAGDGGDELFAGNKRYADDAVFDMYAAIPAALRRAFVEPLASKLAFAQRAGIFGKALRYVEHAKKSVLERLAENLYQAVPPSVVFSSEAMGEIDTNAPLALTTEIYNLPADASKVQRMMNLDLRVTLADSDLRKVVRMCELAGVRTRFPFLHDDLAEFSAGIPETVLMEAGKLRQFYKDSMRGFLPDAIIDKKKHGFGLPYTAFMNSHVPLREVICDSLTNLKKTRYFNEKFLDELTDRVRHGRISGHETAAWDLVVLDRWLESRVRP
jgi:asparagine synthase (glutamine-hydrolysing)